MRRAARYGDAWLPYMYTPEMLADSMTKIARFTEEAGRPAGSVQGGRSPSRASTRTATRRSMANERLCRHYNQDFTKRWRSTRSPVTPGCVGPDPGVPRRGSPHDHVFPAARPTTSKRTPASSPKRRFPPSADHVRSDPAGLLRLLVGVVAHRVLGLPRGGRMCAIGPGTASRWSSGWWVRPGRGRRS